MRPTGFWTRCQTAVLTSCLLGLPLAVLSLETQAAEPDFITLVIENEGDYPITFEPPFHVDSSDFERKYPVSVPKYATAKGLESGPVMIGARQQGMLVMALSKPMFNIFDIFHKDWGFNLKFCQERGACDEARLSGTISSTTSFNWKQSNNFSDAQVHDMTNDELEAYAKTKVVISGILSTLGSVLGLPIGAGGMIGGLPDAQNFKVTLKQQCNARFSMSLEPSLAPNGDFLVDLRINRVLPSDMVNFNGFVIDDSAVVSQGLRLVENGCRDGRQAQCLIRLNGGTEIKNLNTTEFAVTDRAGCKAGDKLAYSQGAFMLSNKVGFPVRYTLFIKDRMVDNGEVWPDQNKDLRQLVGQVMATVGDQECPQAQDPWMGGRRMGVCPLRLEVQGDGGPGLKGSLRCSLSMRQGTVGDPNADYMNLYSLTGCTPAMPASISPVAGFYQMDIKRMVPLSGMYKMISIDLIKPQQQ
ncbi:hypothetical protein C5U62_04450 [Pseudomonas protegens]|uniref:Pilus assembly protein n=1 Tax=Pseudomonas protegens TaxID=380021 RepID=A0A2T6GSV8_9PSED|nr:MULTISPECIES: hypothetical protein [Pseudomonas]PUA47236.1 hypothetical protein C5U62_04450 [Pseudomonas protegens]ULT67935.1 hypothetical protein L1O02_16075 [Pseudomonas sp. BC42]